MQLRKLLSCPWEAFATELWAWRLLQACARTRRSYYNTICGNIILFCCIHSLDINTSFLSPATSIATAHCVLKINRVFITVYWCLSCYDTDNCDCVTENLCGGFAILCRKEIKAETRSDLRENKEMVFESMVVGLCKSGNCRYLLIRWGGKWTSCKVQTAHLLFVENLILIYFQSM